MDREEAISKGRVIERSRASQDYMDYIHGI